MNKNVDDLIGKIIGMVFPDISKKIAWTLIATGLGIIVVPNPVYIIVINYLIDIYNIRFSGGTEFVKINNTGPSSGVGLTIVIVGAIYSLANNFLPYLSEKRRAEIERRKLDSDTQLYHRFLEALPANSESLRLLKEHNFGGSFHNNNIVDMDKFNDEWDISTNHFSNKVLEVKLKVLVDIFKDLNVKLSIKAKYINFGEMLSIVPEAQQGAPDFPEETWEKIREVNRLARSAVEAYDDLIVSCKEELGV